MSYVKLDKEHQETADMLYKSEEAVVDMINSIKLWIGSDGQRWTAIGLTDIEKGFMALRKGVTLSNLQKDEEHA